MNFNTLDLNLLLAFDAVLHTRSTTLAGERIGLTQSAISNSLKRLRQVFDDPLFVKTSDGMMPTPLAMEMAGPIQSALLQIRHAVEDRGDFDPHKSERTFSLCIGDIGQMIMLPPLLEHLRTVAPHVKLETVDVSRQEALGLATNGEIDLVIGFWKGLGEGFHSQQLMREHFVCLARADHPTIRGELTLEQYLSATHAEYRPSGGSYSILEELIKKRFATYDVQRRVALRLAHSAGIAQMITHSDLVIAIPRRLAQTFSDYDDLQILPLPFDSPILDITQQWHGRFRTDRGHGWLRATVASLFRD